MIPAIVIPSRMGSKRLPGKALKMIGDAPLVIQVYRNCQKTGLPVYIKTPDKEIMDAADEYECYALWSPEKDCFNGSDACAEAAIDNDVIINVQGDLPAITPDIIADTVVALEGADVSTPVSHAGAGVGCTLDGKYITGYYRGRGFAHVGVYCYRREALIAYRSFERSENEVKSDLEGWRALDNGLVTRWSWCDRPPHPVDTEEDLEHVRRNWPSRSSRRIVLENKHS